MKTVLMSVAFLFILSGVAKADLPKVCYTTVDGGQFCTTDNLGKVQVFIYSAGWCPSCNEEMAQMPAIYNQFTGQAVIFASLSAEGWSRGEKPDATFLRDWQQRYNIPFVVAGKFKDFGKAFDAPGYIPFAVIVDKQGNVVKSGSLGPSEIGDQVRQLLGRS